MLPRCCRCRRCRLRRYCCAVCCRSVCARLAAAALALLLAHRLLAPFEQIDVDEVVAVVWVLLAHRHLRQRRGVARARHLGEAVWADRHTTAASSQRARRLKVLTEVLPGRLALALRIAKWRPNCCMNSSCTACARQFGEEARKRSDVGGEERHCWLGAAAMAKFSSSQSFKLKGAPSSLLLQLSPGCETRWL